MKMAEIRTLYYYLVKLKTVDESLRVRMLIGPLW